MATLRRDAEFTTYVQARRPWLRRIAYLLCHDWHRADDLTQAAFLRLYLNWGRAQRAENLDAYVRRILVNVFLNEQRSSWWRRTSHLQVDVDEITRSPTDEVDGAIDLVVALAQIPPRQRAALVLRYYCDLSVAETAALLDCSDGTVKSQSSRGLDALRAVLADTRTPSGPTITQP
jgi:RNA polymerase sigma-70 factor (sigma-E family)